MALPGDHGGEIAVSTPRGKEVSVWNVWENSKREEAATGAPTRRREGIVASKPDRPRVCLLLALLHPPGGVILGNLICVNPSFLICNVETVIL